MPRKAYQINETDYSAAKNYLDKKIFMDQGIWLMDCKEDDVQAKADYPPLLTRKPHTTSERIEQLNCWCNRYLSQAQWTQLKNAVRSARRKSKPERLRAGATFTVKLTHDAYTYVKTLAAASDLSISEFLEQRLEPEWEQHQQAQTK